MRKLKFMVDNGNDTIQRHHLKCEFYERDELDKLIKYIPPDLTIVDVGANVGNHTIFFDWYLNPKEIIVIEPIAQSYKLLLQNIALNYCKSVNIDFLGLAMGSRFGFSGIREMFNDNLGATSLKDQGMISGIPQVPGDALFYNKKIDLIKIDVEGMEMDVLIGLADTIARCRPLLFVEVSNSNLNEFDSWINNNNYKIVEMLTEAEWYKNFLVEPA